MTVMGDDVMRMRDFGCLTAETVQSTSLPLQSIDDIHSSDGLPLSVLSVCDGISDNIFQENLQHTTGLFVDQTGDTLHTTTTSKTSDSGLGDALDVISQHLTMPLGTPLSKSFSSFASTRHVYSRDSKTEVNNLLKCPSLFYNFAKVNSALYEIPLAGRKVVAERINRPQNKNFQHFVI
jgi:hypothetical protein